MTSCSRCANLRLGENEYRTTRIYTDFVNYATPCKFRLHLKSHDSHMHINQVPAVACLCCHVERSYFEGKFIQKVRSRKF